jgi:hypothetical protein
VTSILGYAYPLANIIDHCLLHRAAGQAGMGRVLAFAHALHGADDPIKAMISLGI